MHWDSSGHFTKFEVREAQRTNERLMGFDSAHAVRVAGARYTKRRPEADHWQRTEDDPGRPYSFTDAATLLLDFFAEVKRVLTERSVPLDVVRTEETRGGSTP